MPDRIADRAEGDPVTGPEVERHGGRVGRWDRPPAPKDWRYVVGGVGRALMAIGVLMFGFVAYQLWGTGIETARAQNRLEQAFEAAVADRDASPTPTTTTVPGVTTTVASAEQPPPSDVVPGGADLSDVAVDQRFPPVARGDVIARLEIPAIGKDLYVVAGVTLDDLKAGPGWYPDSSPPGQLGNAAIAGHRTTYGAPFFDVDQLVPGDELVVTSITGDRFVYVVTGVEVVSATDYWVVTTRDPTVAELTLTSCHPKYTADERIVVHSVLVPDRSAPVGITDRIDIDGGPPATTPATDPTVAPTATVADEPVTTAPGTSPPVAAPATDPPAQLDAFSHGWFADAAAWPQIALWGVALALITTLAYQAAKRARHTGVGVLVGIVPFLVALYFFYQNVNRLLPPGM